MQEMNKLFVGNLSFSMDEADLQEAFGVHGEISDITIPLDRETKRSKGFGFITFKDENSAKNALALNDKELGGRKLRVSIANSKEERGGSGGGRGDDRGGRSRY